MSRMIGSSLLMISSVSAGVLPMRFQPGVVTKRSVKAGWATISRTSALILSTIGCGVPAGAARPNQMKAWISGWPISVVVGTSGKSGERSLAASASALTLPAFRSPPATPLLPTESWISLPVSAASTGATPL